MEANSIKTKRPDEEVHRSLPILIYKYAQEGVEVVAYKPKKRGRHAKRSSSSSVSSGTAFGSPEEEGDMPLSITPIVRALPL